MCDRDVYVSREWVCNMYRYSLQKLSVSCVYIWVRGVCVCVCMYVRACVYVRARVCVWRKQGNEHILRIINKYVFLYVLSAHWYWYIYIYIYIYVYIYIYPVLQISNGNSEHKNKKTRTHVWCTCTYKFIIMFCNSYFIASFYHICYYVYVWKIYWYSVTDIYISTHTHADLRMKAHTYVYMSDIGTRTSHSHSHTNNFSHACMS
jgi:hypothetical protein